MGRKQLRKPINQIIFHIGTDNELFELDSKEEFKNTKEEIKSKIGNILEKIRKHISKQQTLDDKNKTVMKEKDEETPKDDNNTSLSESNKSINESIESNIYSWNEMESDFDLFFNFVSDSAQQETDNDPSLYL